MATFADDVLAVIDAERFDRVDVIGHDWGGYVGYLLALKHPERIRRLTVLDMPPRWLDKPRPRHLALPLLGSYQALIAAPVIETRALTAGGGPPRPAAHRRRQRSHDALVGRRA